VKMTASIESMVTHIVARDIAAGVELARSMGYPMPRDYDIGVKFIADGQRTRIRMRLGDVTYDSLVTLPDLDGRMSLRKVDDMWVEAWQRIKADAITVAQVWLGKHPEVQLSPTVASKTLAVLAAYSYDNSSKWIAEAREIAKRLTYIPRMPDLE
jgi:hypothetical protein